MSYQEMQDKKIKDKLETSPASAVYKRQFVLNHRAFKIAAIICCLMLYLNRGYFSVTPAINSEQIWIQELADTMTEFYALLIKMRYLKADAVTYPPHRNPSINITLARELDMSADAILLLQLLPYVKCDVGWTSTAENSSLYFGTQPNMFVMSTAFADFRDDDTLRASRDPWSVKYEYGSNVAYEGDDDGELGEYMKPWQVMLTSPTSSHPWNLFLAVDMKTRRLWSLGSGTNGELGVPGEDKFVLKGSYDPQLRGQMVEGVKALGDHNDLDKYVSRPAIEALKSYMDNVIKLDWMPGFDLLSNTHPRRFQRQHDDFKSLYTTHGWPNNFDASGFDSARKQWEQKNNELYVATRPLRNLWQEEYNLKLAISGITESEDELAAFSSTDAPETKSRYFNTRAKGLDRLEAFKKRKVEHEFKVRGYEKLVEKIEGRYLVERDRIRELFLTEEQTKYPWRSEVSYM